MSRINLYFGGPCNDWAVETSDEIAINNEISVDYAISLMFDRIIELINAETEGKTSIGKAFSFYFDRPVLPPKLSTKQYKNRGAKYPMVIISDDFVIDQETGRSIPITEDGVLYFAKRFEEELGFEFTEFKWTGARKWLQSIQGALF